MKITKRQLKRIINEEKARLTTETQYASSHEEKTMAKEGPAVELDAIDMLNDILDDWDNDPDMSGQMDYYNRIVGVTKLLEGH
jgi:hypothetical protein